MRNGHALDSSQRKLLRTESSFEKSFQRNPRLHLETYKKLLINSHTQQPKIKTTLLDLRQQFTRFKQSNRKLIPKGDCTTRPNYYRMSTQAKISTNWNTLTARVQTECAPTYEVKFKDYLERMRRSARQLTQPDLAHTNTLQQQPANILNCLLSRPKKPSQVKQRTDTAAHYHSIIAETQTASAQDNTVEQGTAMSLLVRQETIKDFIGRQATIVEDKHKQQTIEQNKVVPVIAPAAVAKPNPIKGANRQQSNQKKQAGNIKQPQTDFDLEQIELISQPTRSKIQQQESIPKPTDHPKQASNDTMHLDDIKLLCVSVPVILNTFVANVPNQLPYYQEAAELAGYCSKHAKAFAGLSASINWHAPCLLLYEQALCMFLLYELAYVEGLRLHMLDESEVTGFVQDNELMLQVHLKIEASAAKKDRLSAAHKELRTGMFLTYIKAQLPYSRLEPLLDSIRHPQHHFHVQMQRRMGLLLKSVGQFLNQIPVIHRKWDAVWLRKLVYRLVNATMSLALVRDRDKWSKTMPNADNFKKLEDSITKESLNQLIDKFCQLQ